MVCLCKGHIQITSLYPCSQFPKLVCRAIWKELRLSWNRKECQRLGHRDSTSSPSWLVAQPSKIPKEAQLKAAEALGSWQKTLSFQVSCKLWQAETHPLCKVSIVSPKRNEWKESLYGEPYAQENKMST